MELKIEYPVPYRKILSITGLVGILASLLVGSGEFLVHYAGEAIHSPVPYEFFLSIPSERLPLGQVLIVAGLPLYVIGYIHLFLALVPGSRRLAAAVFLIGIYAFMIGGIWVGSRAFLGSLVQLFAVHQETALYAEVLRHYRLLLENLVQVLRILVLVNSGVFVFAILRFRTLYPRWMVLFNPTFLLLFVFLLFFKVPAIGNYLAPTAMNVAHLILFSVSLLALRTSQEK